MMIHHGEVWGIINITPFQPTRCRQAKLRFRHRLSVSSTRQELKHAAAGAKTVNVIALRPKDSDCLNDTHTQTQACTAQ